MVQLYEYYNTGDDANQYVYGTVWFAQTFTPSTTHTVTSVKLKMCREGNPGTLTVSIRATSGGKPTGSDLTSGSINANTFTAYPTYTWYEIPLTEYTLQANTMYAIVARAPSGNLSNDVIWRFDSTDPTFEGGTHCASDDSGVTWTIYSTRDFMFEVWGNPVAVAYTKTLTETLGLADSIIKAPSVMKRELLGLSDVYGRTWTAYRAFTETLGLMDTIGKEVSRIFAEALGLRDTFNRTWTIQRVLGEPLGLKDALQKTPSTLKTEHLGLLDSYSRTWLAFRTYTESLGLFDKVSKTATVPLAETLGLFDTMIKSSFTTKTEKIGLADFATKGVSVARTERLGLSDVLRKAPAKTFYEALGLKDVYSRVFTIYRTFAEPLGLKDTVSKGVALHALVEVLGLYDSILYGKNVTVLAKLIRKYMQLVNLGGELNE